MVEPTAVHAPAAPLSIASERPHQGSPLWGERVTSEPVAGLPPLHLGQLVDAKVVEWLPSGRYRLLVAGYPLEAVAPQPLQIGADLVLRVDQLTPAIALQIVSPAESGAAPAEVALLQLLRAQLPRFVELGETLQALRQRLQQRDAAAQGPDAASPLAGLQALFGELFPDDGPPGAEQLARYVRDGGLFYEAKLRRQVDLRPQAVAEAVERDVKGLLLKLAQQLDAVSDRSPRADLSAAIHRHLDAIETQQALHLLAQLHQTSYTWSIPVWLGAALAMVRLRCEADPRQGQGTAGEAAASYRLVFALDLDGLGQTRIDAHATPRALRLVFYVERDEARALLQAELPALCAIMQEAGFAEVLADAKPLTALTPEQRRALEAPGIAVPPSVGLVDVTV
jgi:hypothetical protein